MSDPNQEFQPPPPPTIEGEPERKRPANLLWAGVALVVLGIIVLVGGIAGFIPGGIGTGAAVCVLGVLFFGLSFARLPSVPDAPPPMSTVGRLTGIFFEPTNVFRNLRAHPHWLAAILVIGVLNAAYITAFTRRITPERIINFTVDKLEESPIKPPPEALAKMRTGRRRAGQVAQLPGRQCDQDHTVAGTFFSVGFCRRRFVFWACWRSAGACISGKRMPWSRT